MSAGGRERRLRVAAYGVHVFTATGAVLAVLAFLAALERRFDLAFLWLGLAAVVDGVDGTFARAVDVETRAPRIDGAVLDLVVDYVTYVFVPATILVLGGHLPPSWASFGAGVLCLSAALYFADTRMKTADGGFRGFPACWNVVAFYVAVFEPAPWIALVVVLGLSALQFAPIEFTHPMRVRRLRATNLALLSAWSAAALAALWQWNAEPIWALVTLAGTGSWFMVVGAFGPRAPTPN
jgi:phosphatidylcholine synthase